MVKKGILLRLIRGTGEKMKNKMKDYLGNPDDLKTKIASMCIDMTGSMESDYVVLVRVSRKHGVSVEYHKNEIDGDDTHDRFWYDFPMFFYRDMPSALFIRKIWNGNYYLIDENGNFIQQIDVDKLTEALVDDLLSADYGNFSVRWNEFIAEFQKWLEVE